MPDKLNNPGPGQDQLESEMPDFDHTPPPPSAPSSDPLSDKV